MAVLPVLSHNARFRYFTFFYLYLMQGIPSGFALTAIANYLIGKGLSSAVVGSYVSIIGIPWIVQLIWGPLIDRFRYSVTGYYKHWVVLTQVAAFLASLLLLFVTKPEAQVWLLAGLFFAHSLVASVQDASVDAMAILITPPHERGRVNAFMRGGILLGVSFGAAALSTVLHRWGFTTAVLIQSGILLFFTVIFFFSKLHAADPLVPTIGAGKNSQAIATGPHLPTLFRTLGRSVMSSLSLRIFGVIGLSYFCFSLFTGAYYFYLIRVLKWSDEKVSVISGGWGSGITLLVIIIGGLIADKAGANRLQRWVLLWLAIFLTAFNSIYFLWTDARVAISGMLLWNIADPLYSVAVFPLLMTICNKQVAGSQFTAYMAMINLAGIGGAFITGWLLQIVSAPAIGATAGIMLVGLTGLLFFYKKQFIPPVKEVA